MTEFISIIINAVLGCTTLLGFICYYSANKRLKNSEVSKAETEVTAAHYQMYEERLEHCNQTVEQHNATLLSQSEMITALNETVNSKTIRIREMTDKLWESERETNQLNVKLVEATEKIGKLELQLAKFKDWHCRVADCPHRLPPNPKLNGRTFDEATDR